MDLIQKEQRLKKIIGDLGKAAIAFSGGVDSTYLLKTAHELLGENVIAVTLDTAFFPRSEMDEAFTFTRQYGILHRIIKADVLGLEVLQNNPEDRCYHCKKNGFSKIKEFAQSIGIDVVADGTNADDASDYRPGAAAARELGIVSPLQEAGLTKDEIRTLSKTAGLSGYGKPANACLATRIPYGQAVTMEKLQKIERAEEFMHRMGFMQVRVRMHENLARIEVPAQDMERLINAKLREIIVNEIIKTGFTYVTLDLLGYRTGSMLKEIKKTEAD